MITKNENRNVTIKDVAREAGVAVSTVSRVINNLDRVSDNTRNKVNDAIKKLNFVQNNNAVSIVTGQTKTILILIPNFIYNFFGTVVNGAVNNLNEKGYNSMVICTGEQNLTQYLNKYSNMVDGVLIIPGTEDLKELYGFNKPVVFVDRFIDGMEFDSVTVNNQEGTRKLTQLLIDNGHKHIAIIVGDNNFNVGLGRLDGYIQCLKENHLKIKQSYIRKGKMIEGVGYKETKALLELQNPPTAIIACNNKLALGCANALNELHLICGEDMSIVAFDDSDMAKVYGPGLTVAFAPKEMLGKKSSEHLLSLIENKPVDKHELIDVEIRIRGSIKKLC